MTRPTTAQLNAAYDQFNFWYDKAKKLDEELAKAEERIAELEDAEQKLCAANVTLDARAELAERQLAELESRTVKLPKRSVGEVMHMSGFSRDYAEGWCAGNDNAIHEIHNSGIKVEG